MAKVRVTFLVPILCYGDQVQGKVTGRRGGAGQKGVVISEAVDPGQAPVIQNSDILQGV